MHKIAIISTSVALALGTLSSVALAEPMELTEAQMDQVTAGYFYYDSFNNLYDIYTNVYYPDPAVPGDYVSSQGVRYTALTAIWTEGGLAYGVLQNAVTGALHDGSCDACW
jgi:hypothetical protein